MEIAPAYTEDEWEASAGHRPLASWSDEEVFLLRRHWVWADRQRLLFRQAVIEAGVLDLEALHKPAPTHMYVWYALLFSVLEGLKDRGADLQGPLRDDVDVLWADLKRCRNAVFHVPSRGRPYFDPRLWKFMETPDSVDRIYRVHNGVIRLLREASEGHPAPE